MLSTWKLYFILVLLPQALYLFSFDEKLSVNCEGCSFSNIISRAANSIKKNVESEEVIKNCGYSYSREDELTAALCHCREGNVSEISEKQFLEDSHGGW